MRKNFDQWLDDCIEQAGIDAGHVFEISGGIWGVEYIPLASVIEQIKGASEQEKRQIKRGIANNAMRFFKHLATAMAI